MSNLSLLYSLILAVILISWLSYILFISHLALDAITPNHINCLDKMEYERFVIKFLANVSVWFGGSWSHNGYFYKKKWLKMAFKSNYSQKWTKQTRPKIQFYIVQGVSKYFGGSPIIQTKNHMVQISKRLFLPKCG